MTEPFIYSVRSPGITWLVYVKINCRVLSLNDSQIKPEIDVNPQIKLSTKGTSILPEEIPFAVKGIQLVESYLIPKLTLVPVIIQVTEFTIAITDYQPEGLTYAIAGWLNREYKLNWKPEEVTCDPVKNKYTVIASY